MITLKLKQRKKYTTIYLDINYKGQRWWENTNLHLTGKKNHDKKMMALAEEIRDKRIAEIVSDNFGLRRKYEKDFLTFFKQIIDSVPQWERKVTTYKHLVNFLELNNIKRLTFDKIDENFWNLFKRYLKEEVKHTASTIKLELGQIKSALNSAVRKRIIPDNPLREVRIIVPKVEKTFLDFEDDLPKLYNTPCIHPVVKNAFLFSCYTGIRLGDMETLKKKNFWKDKIVLTMQKTGDSLFIDYEPSTLEYIPNFNELKPDNLVLNLPSRSIIHTTIKSWVLAAGITKSVSYHTSRHTFLMGILLYNEGDILTAGALAGHRNTRTTQAYTHPIDKKKAKAVRNLPKMNKV